jgi:hypothetical protein
LLKLGVLVAVVAVLLLARLTLLVVAAEVVHTITVYLLLLNYQAPLLSLLALAARPPFLTERLAVPGETLTLAYYFTAMVLAAALVMVQASNSAVVVVAYLALVLITLEARR